MKSEALDKRTDDFTIELTKYLHEHFLEFARKRGCCEQGKVVEQLVRKWAYMVRFADWSYHEGVCVFVRFSDVVCKALVSLFSESDLWKF